jgi:dihydroorotate dehydrogenase
VIFYPVIRKALFTIPAEDAHKVTMSSLKVALRLPLVSGVLATKIAGEERLSVSVCSIDFPNPIGLAAGFDKNALYVPELAALGFGHIEIGTVTPKAQSGNPKPRLFRLPMDQAIINRMGFNNDGADVIAQRLEKLRSNGDKTIMGGNIGKNKVTPNEDAINDYLFCLEKLHPYVDYITVNVSSPNTPNLRELQDKDSLKALLFAVQDKNAGMEKRKPVFLKIAPDISFNQLDEILQICEDAKLDGIIATNTTVERELLKSHNRLVTAMGNGGLSGSPLRDRSFEILKYIIENKPSDHLAVISSGGVMNAEIAAQRLEAGANLVQLYTGFIYEGPGLIAQIKKALLKIEKAR